MQQKHGLTERRPWRLANQPRGTQRYRVIRREDEDALTQSIVQLASRYGRYGYRRTTALLKRELAGGYGPRGWMQESPFDRAPLALQGESYG